MYSKTTGNITITVEPSYLADESAPDENHYVWSYHIKIENHGQQSIRLRTRYWKIMDSSGVVQEVEGEGVVGKQPLLSPGESYEYTSGAPLCTPSGIMVGNYGMELVDKGEIITVDIPAFSLDSPYQSTVIH